MDLLIRNIPDETHEAISKVASEKERTITGQIRFILNEFVEKNK